jgi:predicted nucleic acid-binding protein
VKSVLADSGFLVAVYNSRDAYHRRCMKFYESLEAPLATCEPVIAETIYLLSSTPGAANDILASVEEGVLAIPFKLSESAAPVRNVMKKYRDLGIDLADGCLIQMADELDTGDILTLDSDFRHYRWRRNRAFNLLIPLN